MPKWRACRGLISRLLLIGLCTFSVNAARAKHDNCKSEKLRELVLETVGTYPHQYSYQANCVSIDLLDILVDILVQYICSAAKCNYSAHSTGLDVRADATRMFVYGVQGPRRHNVYYRFVVDMVECSGGIFGTIA
ncbi:hypothetical protein NECAME_17525 [Necator americanus]|uniref:ZP domain-containing protein n=1 Tax=Necator americanus TaxID=51031 RepID=W2TQA4_NECAM|nr:hypothetical protein NECAME_17525 [Necator americanus]ETN83281.1 hypothetical protein NECAME_17525 [Necator americanus]